MQRGRLLILVGLLLLVVVIVVVVVLSGGLPGSQTPPAVVTDTSGAVVPVQVGAPTATPFRRVNVVTSFQRLDRGFRFPDTIEELQNIAGYVAWPEIPEEGLAIPPEALRESEGGLEFLLGKVARTDIRPEQPILSSMVVDTFQSLANVGSDAAAILPVDRVAVALPVDRVTSVAYALQDGDHVDILVSMLFVDVDDIFQSITPNSITLFTIKENGDIELLTGVVGRPEATSLGTAIIGPSERQRPRLVTQRTIQDAIVVHVNDFPLNGRFIGRPPTPTPVPQDDEEEGGRGTPPPPPTEIPRPDIVTLAVTPQEAVVLTWYIEARLPVTLALRSATDISRAATTAVTLDYIMSTYRIDVPTKRDFTIEPAIRSIRQLLASSEISLESDSGAAAGG